MPVVDSGRPQEPATVEALNSPVPGAYHLPFKLRSWLTYVDEKFRYTRLDGSISIVAACEQVNDYVFNPATFANAKYPFTWRAGRLWPPQSLQDLCCAPGVEAGFCVGDTCFTNTDCRHADCDHSFNKWRLTAEDWEQHFELRETSGKGIGVFTKRSFKQGQILGWYVGDLTMKCGATYTLGMGIGSVPPTEENLQMYDTRYDRPGWTSGRLFDFWLHNGGVQEEVNIDADKRGNWTRFINHSCDAYSDFSDRCVGAVRISVVQAVRDVPANVELTVHYGTMYFKHKTCLCGAEHCLEKEKAAKRVEKKSKATEQKSEEEVEESLESLQI